jgi:gas vesicle protein GvpG
MLLIDDILFAPVNGILWVFNEISKVAHEGLADEAKSITESLRQLYMELETGRIPEEEFDEKERLLLDRLEALESGNADETDEDDEPDAEEEQEEEE